MTVTGQVKTEPIVISGFVSVGQRGERGEDGDSIQQSVIDDLNEKIDDVGDTSFNYKNYIETILS